MGVDELVWRHTGFANGQVITGMIDHTRDAKGKMRASLLDLVLGRSGQAYGDWLKEQPTNFIQGIKVATLVPFRD